MVLAKLSVFKVSKIGRVVDAYRQEKNNKIWERNRKIRKKKKEYPISHSILKLTKNLIIYNKHKIHNFQNKSHLLNKS